MYTAYLKGSLKLDKEGQWWHEGQPFANQNLSAVFHRAIVWDEQAKDYFIQIGQQRATFDREDTAYFVLALDIQQSPWTLMLAGGTTEPLDPASMRLGPSGQFYCRLKNQHLARLTRPAHQVLLQHVIDEHAVMIDGQAISIQAL